MKFIDLFSGIGGFRLALEKSKLKCVFSADNNKYACETYNKNFKEYPLIDIKKLSAKKIPNHDILCAGFPCQPFSIAGNQKGFQDKTRGNLFYKILEIIDKKQPATLMLENVKNLHTIHKGETFKIIKNELENRGYNVSYKVIDSRFYNSPQSRHRIYIICNKDKSYTFREINRPIVPVSTIIDYTISEYFDFTSKYKLEKCSGKSMMKYKLINKKSGKGGRQGERVYDITKCGPTICASSGGPGAKTGLYYSTLEALGIDIRNSDKIFEVHNKIDVSLRQRVVPFLKGLHKKKVFSLSAEKKEGLDNFFQGIEQNLYKEIIKENIILDARETEKIQWLYKNQIVKSSELKKGSLKLQLIWNSVQRERFNRNFGEKVL